MFLTLDCTLFRTIHNLRRGDRAAVQSLDTSGPAGTRPTKGFQLLLYCQGHPRKALLQSWNSTSGSDTARLKSGSIRDLGTELYGNATTQPFWLLKGITPLRFLGAGVFGPPPMLQEGVSVLLD
jgi:hypothetical protein